MLWGNDAKVAHWMDRIKSIGNGKDSFMAATAFTLLAERAGII
jgi:hypothetical protein